MKSPGKCLLTSLAFTLCGTGLSLSIGPVFADSAPVFKAIDPSQLKLDDGADGAASLPKTPIQGRPLGNSFTPINQGGAANSADPGSGFGTSLSPETDEPTATAQDEERVNSLEQKAFGTNYHEHEVPDRLDHLEKEVFGNIGHGSIGERIAKLEVKLLGGTGFGAPATRLAAAPPPSSSSSVPADNGGQNGGNGDGWLTQPVGTAAQAPSGTGQSDWMMPAQQPQQQQYQPVQQPQQQPQQQQFQQSPPQFQQAPQQQYQQPPQQQFQPPPQQQQYQQPPQQQYQQPQQQQQPLSFGGQAGIPMQMPPQQMVQRPPQQQQQPSQNPQQQPPRAGSMGLTADAQLVANSLFYDTKSGDYLTAIHRFPGQNGQPTFAHWRSFPVRLRMPKESPEAWQRALEAIVARWDQYVPVKLALPLEPAPVEVTWVNQLPPNTLAVTRLNIVHGDMHVIIYMLRPTYYPPEISERTLGGIFMHELGHAVGLFGHSDRSSDLMYPAEVSAAGKGKPQIHFAPVSTRDINTLKKIYESQTLPQTFSLERPLEWSLKIRRAD